MDDEVIRTNDGLMAAESDDQVAEVLWTDTTHCMVSRSLYFEQLFASAHRFDQCDIVCLRKAKQ